MNTAESNSASDYELRESFQRLYMYCLTMVLPSLILALILVEVFIDDGKNFQAKSLYIAQETLIALGCTVVVTCISIFCYKPLFRGSIRLEQEAFADIIVKRFSRDQFRGVRKVVPVLEIEKVADLIRTGHQTIIMDTWIAPLEHCKNGFKDALKNGNKITVILLHPNSPLVKRRALDFAGEVYSVRSEIIQTLRLLKSYRDDWKRGKGPGCEPNLEVYCYDGLPPCPVYLVDGTIYMGLYLKETHSSRGHQIVIDNHEEVGISIQNHINKVLDTDASNLMEVKLDQAIEPQFENKHLRCQLEDAARLISNLHKDKTMDEVQIFMDCLQAQCDSDPRLKEKRKKILGQLGGLLKCVYYEDHDSGL